MMGKLLKEALGTVQGCTRMMMQIKGIKLKNFSVYQNFVVILTLRDTTDVVQ